MNPRAISRRRWALILVLVAVATFAIGSVRPLRHSVLRAVGWALVVNEPIAPADIIVMSLDTGGAGALEAADLVESGIAKRVAVFTDSPDVDGYEFIRRGLPYEDAGARQIRLLKSLGVADVIQIPGAVVGTQGIGEVLQDWCSQHQFRSIVFVALRDHTRRVRRVLDREMNGCPIQLMLRPARYSNFDPDRWWHSREGIRITIVELQKLVLDVVLHPMSF